MTTTTTATAPTIHRYYDPAEAKEALEFTSDINTDLYRQIGLVSYWNNKLVLAEKQYDRLCHAQSEVESALYKNIRAEAIKAGTKMTETQVNAEIQTHARYKQVCGLVIEAKTEMGLLKGMSYALKQRMDVLTTVSRNLQSEMRDATVGGQMQEDRRAKVKSILNGLKAFEDD